MVTSDALEGKGAQGRPQRRVIRRLEEVAKAVGGRLLSVTNAVETGTWWLGTGWAPWSGGLFQCIPDGHQKP